MFWYGLKLDLRVTDNKTEHTHVIKNKTFIFSFNLKKRDEQDQGRAIYVPRRMKPTWLSYI